MSPSPASADPLATPAGASERVGSIDALRGFDMFWIMGGDLLAKAVLAKAESIEGARSFSENLALQFDHEPWEGFRFYDLIYPLFLFLVGCVIPYSLSKVCDQPAQVYTRIIRRSLLLVFLGMVNNRLFQFQWDEMRWTGVLQRIGVCYGAAAVIWLHTRAKTQAVIFAAILLGYWAILAWIPAPGGVAGDLSIERNLGGYIDRNFLPGHIMREYYGFGDNEGILSTLPAVATALLGVLTGTWLRSAHSPIRKFGGMLLAGAICLPLGYGWGQLFPIIKNLWTSSYVLVAGGWSLLLLGAFYLVIDVWRIRRWAWPFVVIGLNAVTIYVASEFIKFEEISRFFFGGLMSLRADLAPAILYSGSLTAQWLFLWFLYRHKVFLRV
ncbi:MAG: DUF5009 domain-containing protein [Planctomycetes bacterium]|nr:DUF5009 domain-containing protein [Planctomycetota bacterium]